MRKWLDRLTGRGAPPPDPFAALRDYPSFTAPHRGPPSAWTDAQADENLAHLLQHRAQRVAHLVAWLRTHAAIDATPALGGGDPTPLLDALHQWANARWPAWHQPAIAREGVWLRSARAGEERVYALLLDVALLLGELVLQRNPRYRWALDLDDENGRDGMTSYRRPVLLLAAYGGMPCDIPLDLEHQVVARYLHPEQITHRLHNDWAETVVSAIEGRQEAVWVDAPPR